jgi:tRNA uridine 5-carbamoylmethylation protein Kti12
MEKKLQIVVLGEPNSGKSTMMYHLEKVLRENGFVVDIQIHDPFTTVMSDFRDIHDFHDKIGVNHDERLKILKDTTKITLKELTVKRKDDCTKKEDGRSEVKTNKNNRY